MPDINGVTLIVNNQGADKDKSNMYPEDLQEIAAYIRNTDSDPVKVTFASDQGTEQYWKNIVRGVREDVPARSAVQEDKQKSSTDDLASNKSSDSEENKPSLFQSIKEALIPSRKEQSRSSNKKVDVAPADIINAESLNDIIPLGFLLLHNDIISSKKSSGALAGAAAGAGAGLLSSLFGGMSKSVDPSISAILEDPEIQAKIKSDPTIYNIMLEGTRTYVTAYYANILKQFGITKVEDSAGKGITGYFNNILSLASATVGAAGNAVGAAFGGIATQVTSAVSNALQFKDIQKEINEEENLKAIHREGITQYVTAYYANILKQFGITKVEDSAGKGITGFFNNVLSGLGAIVGEAGTAAGAAGAGAASQLLFIKSINPLIDDAVTTARADTEVKNIQSTGIKNYLTAFYAYLLSALNVESLDEDVDFTKKPLAALGKAIKRLGKKATQIDLTTSTQSVADSLTEIARFDSNTSELSSDTDILNIKDTYAKQLIAIYYANVFSAFGVTSKNIDSILDEEGNLKPGWENVVSTSKYKFDMSNVEDSLLAFLAPKDNAGLSEDAISIRDTALKDIITIYSAKVTSGLSAAKVPTIKLENASKLFDFSAIGGSNIQAIKTSAFADMLSSYADTVISKIEDTADWSDIVASAQKGLKSAFSTISISADTEIGLSAENAADITAIKDTLSDSIQSQMSQEISTLTAIYTTLKDVASKVGVTVQQEPIIISVPTTDSDPLELAQ